MLRGRRADSERLLKIRSLELPEWKETMEKESAEWAFLRGARHFVIDVVVFSIFNLTFPYYIVAFCEFAKVEDHKRFANPDVDGYIKFISQL